MSFELANLILELAECIGPAGGAGFLKLSASLGQPLLRRVTVVGLGARSLRLSAEFFRVPLQLRRGLRPA